MKRALLLAGLMAVSVPLSAQTTLRLFGDPSSDDPYRSRVRAGYAGPSTRIDIAAFRRTHFTLEMPILDPFERLLREGGTHFALIGVENLASHFNGGEYLLRLPEPFVNLPPLDPDLGPVSRRVRVFETANGFFLLGPQDDALLERFEKLARDPASYPNKETTRVRPRRALLTRSAAPAGGELHTLRIQDTEAVQYPQWRSTVALVYRFRTGGRDYDALFLYKTLGGEGRLASALKALRSEVGGELLALNRGEIFTVGPTKTTGTLAGFRFEGMGVQASVVSEGELFRLQDVFDYMAASPGGVRFLSANLVYSTDTAKNPLPAYKIFEVKGRRIAVFGLTRRESKTFIRPEFASSYTIRDPIQTAAELVPKLRREADIVVALTNISTGKTARLKKDVKGIDLIVGQSFPFQTDTALETVSVEDPERGPFDEALLISGDWPTVLTHLELKYTPLEPGYYGLSVRQEHLMLDESLPDGEGYPKFKPAGYGVAVDTQPPVLPSARRLYAGGGTVGYTRLESEDFWRLAASLACDRAGAEAAFLPDYGLFQRTTGDYQESLVREWFRFKHQLMTFELSGGALQGLVSEAKRQEDPAAAVPAGGLRMAVGGVGEGNTIHGVPIEGGAMYRVAATRSLMARTDQYPAFAGAKNIRPLGHLDDIVIDQLRRRAEKGWPLERYRALMKGRPVRETGLWKVNIRDFGMNVSNTKVVSDPAFDEVSNARIRGFDELLIGAVSKTDVEYYKGKFKQTNTLEIEYSRSQLRPPGQPDVLSTPKNRLNFRTGATVKAASFPWHRFARSFGPALSVEYDGHVERLPLQRRKHVVSLLPGVEFYGGDYTQTFQLSGNFRRDFTPPVPLNNYGLRARGLFSRSFGRASLSGEFWSNYFIRTRQDTGQDLRLELNANVKLNLKLFEHFTVAPFLDYYYFILKVRPVSGYSMIAGISFSFSRLWKPQYEKFF